MSDFNQDPGNQFGQQPAQPQGPGMQQPGFQGNQPPQQPQQPQQPQHDEGWESQKTQAALAHILGPAVHWVMCGIGILVAIGPMVIWKLNRGKGLDHLEDQAKEALNFQICVCGIQLVLIPVLALLALAMGWWVLLVNFLLLAVPNIIFGAMAAMAAKQGVTYRYPVNFRIIK